MPSKLIRQWAMEESGIPEWLFMESRDTVGDTAETIALLLPNNTIEDETPLALVEQRLLPLRKSDEETQHREVLKAWHGMNYAQRLVYNKLISGAFRIGISQQLVMRACRSFPAWKPTSSRSA